MKLNRQRIWAVISKEWREILRDRLFFSLAFLVPPLLMVLFGYGMSLDVENIPLVIVDHDHSALSREYTGKYINSRYFDFKGYVSDERELTHLFDTGEAKVAIIVPPEFTHRLKRGRPATVQSIIEGTSPFRAQTTKGYVIAINGDFSNQQLIKFMAKQRGISVAKAKKMLNAIRLDVRFLYNEAISSTWSMVPSLIMLLLMITPPFLTAVSVVREKENGSIYNIYSSTLLPSEYLLGKLLPYITISMINCLALWLMAVYWFEVPFKGSFGFFMLSALGYVACTTGMGLLVSILVQSQLAAIAITGIVSFLPVIMFSGLIVPIKSLSLGGQIFAHMIPAMYFNEILQGLFLKGLPARYLSLQALFLFAHALVLFYVGVRVFTKRPAK
jgi:ABC-2 type transport system permease protein